MWDLQTIKTINDELRRESSGMYVVSDIGDCSMKALRAYGGIPMASAELLDNEPIEKLFVDATGWGSPTEPAMTQNAFVSRLKSLYRTHGKLLVGIMEQSQFQVYVGVWSSKKQQRITL